MDTFYIIKNNKGQYYRSKKFGWTPFFDEALLLTDLSILDDIIDPTISYKIEEITIKKIGNSKAVFKTKIHKHFGP